MANPQIENGHVDIANELIEALARTRISGEEMQCLWVIFRKTYGWHKKEDKISISQFSLMTGLKRQTAYRALKKLVVKNIVIKNDDSRINKYRFNKDFDKWVLSSKKITCHQKRVQGVINNDYTSSSKMMNTKENNKRKDTKEKPLDVKIFIDFYYEEFKKKFGKPPYIKQGKDGKLIKNLLKDFSLERLKELLIIMFDSSDPFILKTGYTIGVFDSVINKLLIGNQSKYPGLKKIWNEWDGYENVTGHGSNLEIKEETRLTKDRAKEILSKIQEGLEVKDYPPAILESVRAIPFEEKRKKVKEQIKILTDEEVRQSEQTLQN